MDSLRADRLGWAGHDAAATPTMDALAKRGTAFTNTWTPAPEAPPAVASLLTGLYPVSHGILTAGVGALPDEAITLAEALEERGYATAAYPASLFLHSKYGLDQGFEEYRTAFSEVPRPRYLPDDGVPAGPVTDRALEFLERAKDRPFFLWVNYVDPHYFYAPPAPFSETFSDSPYDGEIAYVDRELGRLLDKLRDYDLEAGTVVILAGTNGEGLGSGGEEFHGTTLQTATTRVPLVIAAGAAAQDRGLGPGLRSERTASLVDVMPTALDLLGFPHMERADGISLLSEPDPSRAVYVGTWMPARRFGWAPLTGVVANGWKFVSGLRGQLHEVAADPEDTADLSSTQPEIRERLARLASDHFRAGTDEAPSAELRERIAALGYAADPAPRAPVDPRDRVGVANDALRADRSALRRQLEAADFLIRSVLDRDPDNTLALIDAALLAGARGDLAAKRRLLEKARALSPARGEIYYHLGILATEEAGEGGSRAGDAQFALAAALDPMHEEALYNTACALATEGKAEAALDTLQRAVDQGFRAFEWMAFDKDLDAVRDDPRFEEITQGKARKPEGAGTAGSKPGGSP